MMLYNNDYKAEFTFMQINKMTITIVHFVSLRYSSEDWGRRGVHSSSSVNSPATLASLPLTKMNAGRLLGVMTVKTLLPVEGHIGRLLSRPLTHCRSHWENWWNLSRKSDGSQVVVIVGLEATMLAGFETSNLENKSRTYDDTSIALKGVKTSPKTII